MADEEMVYGGEETPPPHVVKLVDDKLKSSLQSHKDDMLKEMTSLFQKISDNSNSSQLNKISNIIGEIPKFKRRSNEQQYRHNAKVSATLSEAEHVVETNSNDCKAKISEAIDMIDHRQKLIRLADASELGWRVVEEYETNPLADDSEDERRMYKAEARANRKLKAERVKKSRTRKPAPYRKPPPRPSFTQSASTPSTSRTGLCFQCGKFGHWKRECPGNVSNNKMSTFSDILSKSCTSKLEEAFCVQSVTGKISCNYANIEEHAQVNKLSSDVTPTTVVTPVGRLKQHIAKWRSVAGDSYITDVVDSGYKLPFKTVPTSVVLRNNKSARDNPNFVEEEISNLLNKGVISKVQNKPRIVNPLTVAYNKVGKPRLVLDCRHINPHLHLFHVKFEDISVAQSIFELGSFLFTFDLKSAYHHIDIFDDHKTFLGFSWSKDGKTSYYVYNSLPFGIATAGHIFTKVLRVVVSYIRALGHNIIMFLDDGIGGHVLYSEAVKSSCVIKSSLENFGFLLADEKCSWNPSQTVTWLGHVLNYSLNHIFVTEERIQRLVQSISIALNIVRLDRYNLLSVRTLASIVGQIISLYSVLGTIVRLKTREMYNCILVRASWNSPVCVTGKAFEEFLFWFNNVQKLNVVGKSLLKPQSCQFTVFCDASGDGYGGYIRSNLSIHSDFKDKQAVSARGEMFSSEKSRKPHSEYQEMGFSTYFDVFSITTPKVDSFTFPEGSISETPEADDFIEPELGTRIFGTLNMGSSVSPEVDDLMPPEVGSLVSPEVGDLFNPEVVSFIPPEVGKLVTPEVVRPASPEVGEQVDSTVNSFILPEIDDSMSPVTGRLPSSEAGGILTSVKRSLTLPEVSSYRVRDQYEVVGVWTPEESLQSSTWRETEAINRVIRSNVKILKNCSVKVYSDNKNVKSVLTIGSRKDSLHSIATSINSFCKTSGIKLCPEWIPREENQLADHLSRCTDSDDWSIAPSQFSFLDSLWGIHSIDRFATSYNNHCKRFNSRWWVPNTEGVNAFDQIWANDNNWVVPPPRLASDCLSKMQIELASGTLVIPFWKSAAFWPKLVDKKGNFRHFIKDFRMLPKSGSVCISKGNNGIFAKDPLSFNMIALKIHFT